MSSNSQGQEWADKLKLMFPISSGWFNQSDTGTPAVGELSVRQSLALAHAQAVSDQLDSLNTAFAAHVANVGAVALAAQGRGPAFAGAWLNNNTALSTNYLYVGLGDIRNVWPNGSIASATCTRDWAVFPTPLANGAVGSNAHYFYSPRLRVSGGAPGQLDTQDMFRWEVVSKQHVTQYDWPNVLFQGGKYNAGQTEGMAYLHALATINETFWRATFGKSGVASSDSAIKATIAALVQAVQKVQDTATSTKTQQKRTEVELICGFAGLGAGAVFIGSTFTAGVAAIEEAIAALAAEDAAALAAQLLEDAAAAGIANKDLSELQRAIDNLGGHGANVAQAIRDHADIDDSLTAVLGKYVSDCLGQCSVLVDGREVMLLEHLYVVDQGDKIPLSEAMKGMRYEDTSGTDRAALVTLISPGYHRDMSIGRD